jgi:hypothetical protein
MDWMCIPGSGSSSGGGAFLLVVLVLKAAARPPSTLPSMVGCCVPTPLSSNINISSSSKKIFHHSKALAWDVGHIVFAGCAQKGG